MNFCSGRDHGRRMKVFEQRHKITTAEGFFQALDGMNLDNVQNTIARKSRSERKQNNLVFPVFKTVVSLLVINRISHIWNILSKTMMPPFSFSSPKNLLKIRFGIK